MNIFGKKNNNKENPANEAVNESVRKEKEYQDTQGELDEVRKLIDEINWRFSDLLNRDYLQKCQRVAIKNAEVYGALASAPAEEKSDDNAANGVLIDEEGLKRSMLDQWEKDLYILPAGYQQAVGADPEANIVDLNTYIQSIQVLQHAFRTKTSADSVGTGARQILPFVIDFLSNLKNALERGWAMKANASLDMIKYIQAVGHCYQDFSDSQDQQERTDARIDFLNDVAKQLIEAIDSYYDQITVYRESEKEYTKEFDSLVAEYKNYQRNCPKEYRDLIDRLGQTQAMSTLPPTHPARKYLIQIVGTREHLAKVWMLSMSQEAAALNLITLRGSIDSLVFECRKAKSSSGKEFDFAKHMSAMRKIRDKNIDEINKANDRTAVHLKFLDETQSLIKEAANNLELAEKLQDTAMALEAYEKMQETAEALKEKEERARIAYDSAERKREMEKIERKNEAEMIRQAEEAELARLEEELENLRMNEPNTADPNTNEDNRQVITALN